MGLDSKLGWNIVSAETCHQIKILSPNFFPSPARKKKKYLVQESFHQREKQLERKVWSGNRSGLPFQSNLNHPARIVAFKEKTQIGTHFTCLLCHPNFSHSLSSSHLNIHVTWKKTLHFCIRMLLLEGDYEEEKRKIPVLVKFCSVGI